MSNYRGSSKRKARNAFKVLVLLLIVALLVIGFLSLIIIHPVLGEKVEGINTESWITITDEDSGKVFPKGTVLIVSEENDSYLPLGDDGRAVSPPVLKRGLVFFLEDKKFSFTGVVQAKCLEDFDNVTIERSLIQDFEETVGENPAIYFVK